MAAAYARWISRSREIIGQRELHFKRELAWRLARETGKVVQLRPRNTASSASCGATDPVRWCESRLALVSLRSLARLSVCLPACLFACLPARLAVVAPLKRQVPYPPNLTC